MITLDTQEKVLLFPNWVRAIYSIQLKDIINVKRFDKVKGTKM